VDRFVLENGGYKAVRGWLAFDYEQGPLIGLPSFWRFSAHSVVERVDGRLFDITPNRASQRYPFIRHPGPEGEFEALIDSGIMYLEVMPSGCVSIGMARA